jgi:hypothetical protein
LKWQELQLLSPGAPANALSQKKALPFWGSPAAKASQDAVNRKIIQNVTGSFKALIPFSPSHS